MTFAQALGELQLSGTGERVPMQRRLVRIVLLGTYGTASRPGGCL